MKLAILEINADKDTDVQHTVLDYEGTVSDYLTRSKQEIEETEGQYFILTKTFDGGNGGILKYRSEHMDKTINHYVTDLDKTV